MSNLVYYPVRCIELVLGNSAAYCFPCLASVYRILARLKSHSCVFHHFLPYNLKDVNVRGTAVRRSLFVLRNPPVVKEVHRFLDHCKDQSNGYHDDHCAKARLIAGCI